MKNLRLHFKATKFSKPFKPDAVVNQISPQVINCEYMMHSPSNLAANITKQS